MSEMETTSIHVKGRAWRNQRAPRVTLCGRRLPSVRWVVAPGQEEMATCHECRAHIEQRKLRLRRSKGGAELVRCEHTARGRWLCGALLWRDEVDAHRCSHVDEDARDAWAAPGRAASAVCRVPGLG